MEESNAGHNDFVFLNSTSLCLLCCRFGFDVPVILRSSDESESILPTPEKQMVQVTNPFGLEIGSGAASVTGKNSHHGYYYSYWVAVISFHPALQ